MRIRRFLIKLAKGKSAWARTNSGGSVGLVGGSISPGTTSAFLKTPVFKNMLDFLVPARIPGSKTFVFALHQDKKERKTNRKNVKLIVLQMVD